LLALSPGAAAPLTEGPVIDVDEYHDGVDLMLAGRHREALAKLIPFSDRHFDHFMAWLLRGACHDGVGQNSDAAAAFTVCGALRPDLAGPRFNRGLIRIQQRRYADAVQDFDEALHLRPAWTGALINRAVAREGCRDLAGAETDLTAALAQP